MSMGSAFYADYAERVRKEWLEMLRTAYEARDWEKVARILAIIEKHRFTE